MKCENTGWMPLKSCRNFSVQLKPWAPEACQHTSTTTGQRLNKALRSLYRRTNLNVLPADKGGWVVILDADGYRQKASAILNDTFTYQKPRSCQKFITNKFVTKDIRDIAAKCQEPGFFNRLFSNNGSLAYFSEVTKLNKPNVPLRPINSSLATVTRRLAVWLASLLTPYLGIISTAHLRNSLDFEKQIGRI